MKILFVGTFRDFWSTHFQMVAEFRKKGHKTKIFEFRPKTNFLKKIDGIFNSNLSEKFDQSFKGRVNQPQGQKNLPNTIRKLRYYLFGNWQINRMLLENVKKGAYDLVFFAKAETINYSLISKINNYSKTWYYFMDPLINVLHIDAHRYAALCNWSSSTFSSVNAYFKRYGANSYFITQGINPDIFRPDEKKLDKEIDVIFIGSTTPKRENYINYLKEHGINIVCYGSGWKNKPIYMKELVDIYRKSRIILNFTRGKAGFSIRVFQAIGIGALVLSEYCLDLKKIFDKGVHLDWFNTPEECLRLVIHYLENSIEREKIAKNGRKFVHDNYSWKKIIEKI